MKTYFQIFDAIPAKGITEQVSNAILRTNVGRSNHIIEGNVDGTRDGLNFEVVRGGIVTPVNKISSLVERFFDSLYKRGIANPNSKLKPDELEKKGRGRRTCARIFIGGSKERMRELAFGDQQVSDAPGANNSHVIRSTDIEQWAVDMYNFMVKVYGEDNIVAFVVHLDQKNPGAVCVVLPVTEQNKLSWHMTFGHTIPEFQQKMSHIHDELAEVNKKYGLQRGMSKAVSIAHRTRNGFIRKN